jgi:hypothetical protein
MTSDLTDYKATSNAHMRRDLQQIGKWQCECEACHEIRSLVGMEKMFNIWPMIREIETISDQLEELSEGPERDRLREHSLALYDRLAEAMAK